MSELVTVNPQILNAIEATQQATLHGSIAKHAGAGKAYQSVSQSAAIAIQDATDQLRNFNTLGSTAIGVALAQMLATGNVDKYAPVIAQATTVMQDSAANFKTIGSNAGEVLSSFPVGDS